MVVVVRRYRLRVTGCGSRVLRFCHPSTPRTLSGAIAHQLSTRQTQPRIRALAEPIEFSLGFLVDEEVFGGSLNRAPFENCELIDGVDKISKTLF
jgi:hypothetical protein